MFCGNCGAENVNDAKFCRECGKPLVAVSSQGAKKTAFSTNGANTNVGKANSAPSVAEVNGSQVTAKGKTLPKKVIISACAAIAVLIVIICAAANLGKTIKLDNYLIVETEGYDGYGTARAIIDWETIEKKYGSKMSFTNAAKNELGGMLNIMTPIEAVQEDVSVKLERNNGLSNGDVITYSWDIDEDLSKYVKCKIKFKDGDFTVSGLTEVGTFDAFADLKVEFFGVAPNGSANLNYTGSEINYYDFACDKTSGLSNGDTITVSIDDRKLEYYAENLGKVPAELEKKFTVDGLESYLSKISEIDDTALVSMQQQAVDVYNAKAAQDWGEGESLETLTYIGDYLLTVKNKDSWGTNNCLFLIYKAQVRNNYSNDGKSYNKLNDIYWYIRYADIMVGADGSVNVDVTDYSTPNNRFIVDSGVDNGWWSTKYWYYYGYETLDDLYKDVVTANIDAYNHEDNVDESAAPKAVEQEEIADAKGDYILAGSDTELLTKRDLEGLSAEECKLARNEIYARHGRKFKDKDLQAYFDACDWYEGTIEADDFSEKELSDIEIANKDLIVEYEKEKGYR